MSYIIIFVAKLFQHWEKVYFRSQILERPSIGQYWNISGVPSLLENMIFTFFRKCWCYSEFCNTGTQKWSSIVQFLCTSIWDLNILFSQHCYCLRGYYITVIHQDNILTVLTHNFKIAWSTKISIPFLAPWTICFKMHILFFKKKCWF